MALEDLTGSDKYITALVPTNPLGDDDRRQGDDHIRGVKNVLLNTFPALNGPVTATDEEINRAAASDPATKVNKAGDTMTGFLEFTDGYGPTFIGEGGGARKWRLVLNGAGGDAIGFYSEALVAFAMQIAETGTISAPYGVRATQFVATPTP